MKRTAMQHTKLKRLVRTLNVPQYAAVGILESLWHLTAREAPGGNIGKLSDEDIAFWIDWRGDHSELIKGLVSCGWLDEDAEFRLVVHDWHEHADDATKKAMSRHVQTTADKSRHVRTSPVVSGQNTPASASASALPVPEPSQKKAITADAVPASRGKLLGTLPLNDRTEYEVREDDLARDAPLYPGVDVTQGYRAMKAYLLANPRKLKTRSGIRKFMNGWLSRAQNDGGTNGSNQSNQQSSRVSPATQRRQESSDNIKSAFAGFRGGYVGATDGPNAGPLPEPDTPAGHPGHVRGSVGGDGSEVWIASVHGRTIEGHSL